MVWDDENDYGAKVKRVGFWTQLERQRMNAAFTAAMLQAGFALTAASTVAGTVSPSLAISATN